MKTFSSRFDERFKEALQAISNIELRGWPEDAPLYTFHESFTSDIALVKAFCRDRRVFGRNSRVLVKHWEAIGYLSTPVFLYYLPAVLLAMIEQPRHALSEILLDGRLDSDHGHFTSAEREAVESVRGCLLESGITRESIRADIERGKQKARELGYDVDRRRFGP